MLANLSNLISLLIALSVATERLVDIIKNFFPSLRAERPDAAAEGRRKSLLQVLAALAGILTTFLAAEVLPALPIWGINGAQTPAKSLILLGLLASGGSGFWTSILGYVNNLKEIKKTKAVDKKVQTAANVAAIARGQRHAPPKAMQLDSSKTTAEALPETNEAEANLQRAIALANLSLSGKV